MDKGRNSVIICIPIYKSVLSDTEKISLVQLNRVLGNYPRCFVAPESLHFDYGQDGENISVERFPDYYFKNIKGYSNLLLDVKFYRRFAAYEYMLIYQLDAFVFKDELEHFCNMGYDYIGAPIARFNALWHAMGARVGNGGFSLRRISAAVRMLEQWFSISTEHPLQNLFWQAEDLFWGYCGVMAEFDFNIPSVEVALNFAVQDNVGHAFQKMDRGWRPFGCHAWCKNNRSFWQPHIEKYGYIMSEADAKPAYTLETLWLLDYLRSRGNVNMCLIWGAWRKKNYELMGKLLEKWLALYQDNSAIWQGKTEWLAYLSLMVESEKLDRGIKVRLQLDICRALLLALAAEEPAAHLWYVLLSVAIYLDRYDYEVAEALGNRIKNGFWEMWESNAGYATVASRGEKKLMVITAVRDEVGVLESFVRHTLSFADTLVVEMCLASRRAGKLLKRLQEEKLPIKFVYGHDSRKNIQTGAQVVLELEPYDFLLANQPGKSVGQILAGAGAITAYEVPVFAYQVWMGRLFGNKFLLSGPLWRELQAGTTAVIGSGPPPAVSTSLLHIARFSEEEEKGRKAGRIPDNMDFVDISPLINKQSIYYEKNL